MNDIRIELDLWHSTKNPLPGVIQFVQEQQPTPSLMNRFWEWVGLDRLNDERHRSSQQPRRELK